MTKILRFQGFIKAVSYRTYLHEYENLGNLTKTTLEEFNINTAKPYGLISSPTAEIAYSQWVSPKRTRSYPFARIYNTYNFSKVITIIPVIKDEGKDGDRDRIQFSTISWMNLANIYIVLAYYETALKSRKKGQENKNKLNNQNFDNDFVKFQINEILNYRQSALHWNKNLFEERFTKIFTKALNCYDTISKNTGVEIHSREGIDTYLEKIKDDFNNFKNISLKDSKNASQREAITSHKFEHLVDGLKANFIIKNYLGGLYYLTPDEIFYHHNVYIIQESKNSTKDSLPKLADIQDGLFKLILFSNLDSLLLNNQPVSFISKLKLTGKNVIGTLILPTTSEKIQSFLETNNKIFKKKQQDIIKKLALETEYNLNLQIEITNNN